MGSLNPCKTIWRQTLFICSFRHRVLFNYPSLPSSIIFPTSIRLFRPLTKSLSLSPMISPPLPSPGVGARRKGNLPRLPLSAFTPPNTGASDQFPLAPSPSTVQPQKVLDASVVLSTPDLTQWKAQASGTLVDRIVGVIATLQGEETDNADDQVQQ